MTFAWLTIAFLVLGVPLLAWWLGGRRFWARTDARAAADPAAAIMRRHGLSTGEASEVVTAVSRGQALADARQRDAAVELAQLTIEQLFPRWQELSLARRSLRVLAIAWIVIAVTGVVFAVASGRLRDVSWFSVSFVVLVIAAPLWQHRNLRKAVALNSGPAETPTP